MITVDKAQLHSFFYLESESYAEYAEPYTEDDETPPLTEADWQYLKGCVFKSITADKDMSENHPGGDDIVGAVDEVLEAIKEGYQICTWYGPWAEALILGYSNKDIVVIDPPEKADEEDEEDDE